MNHRNQADKTERRGTPSRRKQSVSPFHGNGEPLYLLVFRRNSGRKTVSHFSMELLWRVAQAPRWA
ncbi:hypothetical protein JQK88_27150 [Mesorhizobium caraganae]|uniref:hypothetical protein n=1 Tax=Mesorhizobium caraganae TaxID=483206 RepID=UPI0017829394|nr:hypothetical protein [Mesorhizobium caraganae]MBM2714838.1 hypothetical protein [Mesorhizobium caraganae]